MKADARNAARKYGSVKGELKNFPMSARKMRVVAGELRGANIDKAVAFLSVQRKKAAGPLKQLLESVSASAEKRGMNLDRVYVEEVQINKGPIMRRFMPRAQGRATRIRKQTVHVLVSLSEMQ